MDLDWICRLQINKLAADDAGLAIWSYDPRLPQVFDVIERWGFTFKSVLFTWVKITQAGAPATGTGYTTRKSTEQLLYAPVAAASKLSTTASTRPSSPHAGSTLASLLQRTRAWRGCSDQCAAWNSSPAPIAPDGVPGAQRRRNRKRR
jgi:N6-adenosine-specific RNA methylase IME4